MTETARECRARLRRLQEWQRHARTPGERERVCAWADAVEAKWRAMMEAEKQSAPAAG